MTNEEISHAILSMDEQEDIPKDMLEQVTHTGSEFEWVVTYFQGFPWRSSDHRAGQSSSGRTVLWGTWEQRCCCWVWGLICSSFRMRADWKHTPCCVTVVSGFPETTGDSVWSVWSHIKISFFNNLQMWHSDIYLISFISHVWFIFYIIFDFKRFDSKLVAAVFDLPISAFKFAFV